MEKGGALNSFKRFHTEKRKIVLPKGIDHAAHTRNPNDFLWFFSLSVATRFCYNHKNENEKTNKSLNKETNSSSLEWKKHHIASNIS